jgi:hypothetical protein
MELHLHSINTSSWRGVYLSTETSLPLPYMEESRSAGKEILRPFMEPPGSCQVWVYQLITEMKTPYDSSQDSSNVQRSYRISYNHVTTNN